GLEELRSIAFQQLVHADDAAATLPLIGRMLCGEIPDYVVEHRCRRKDGGTVWVRESVSLVRSAAGDPAWIIALVEDVTERRRADDALRRYELVVRQSRDIILFMRREDGHILEANPAATAAYGHTHDELLALTIHDLRAPGTRKLTQEQMREADREGLLFETVHQRKDGSTFPVEVSSRGATLGEGRTLVSIVRDISERRRAEAREREHGARAERRAAELDAVVDSVAEPLLVTDADGHLVRANPAFERLLGAVDRRDGVETAQRVRQLRLEAPDGRPVDAALVPEARALRGEIVHGVLQRMRRDDGTVVHLSTSSAPIRTAEGVVGAVVVFADVSEQQRAAEALRETDRRKTEFLAVLSHELRNPLAPIRNSIAVMEAVPGSEAAGRAMKILRRQADHLTRLVDDLLDLTRITHGKIELQLARLDLRQVVRETVADARDEFAQGGVDLALFEAGDALWVDADAARVAQMVTNLLGNALKFTPAGGRVRVRVSGDGGACQVAVRDTGVGIERGDLDRIFEPFVQVERTRRSHGGLGIGLALVREMVSKHGGSIHALSDGPGAGAEFVLRLPLAAAPGLRPARKLEDGTALRSVLVVEDNTDAATSLVEFLALRGHRASSVASGRAGIAAVATLRPDVLICDIGLPDVSGYEVIRAVRAMPEGPHVFAIALTGYAQPRDREQALAAGFDAHIPKPPELEELLAMLGGGGQRAR
ncbi:MAG TPA: PAS domain S-box protein, partial [Solirubrobacter sp.]